MGNPELPPQSSRTPAQGTSFKNRTPLPVPPPAAPRQPNRIGLEMDIFSEFEKICIDLTRALGKDDQKIREVVRGLTDPQYVRRFIRQKLPRFPDADPAFVYEKLRTLADRKFPGIFTQHP